MEDVIISLSPWERVGVRVPRSVSVPLTLTLSQRERVFWLRGECFQVSVNVSVKGLIKGWLA